MDDGVKLNLPLTSTAYRRWAGVLLILVFALLYLLTLDNGLRPGELQGGDLITHQYAQVQGRFSNAPGYPLYTMGGWLWFHLGRLLLRPDANPIAILSSYSTLWALVSLGLLYALILEVTRSAATSHATPQRKEFPPEGKRRLWGVLRVILDESDAPEGNWPIAFLVTGFYGVTYFFWYYAVTTEQYTSSVAWTLAVVLLVFRWGRAQRPRYLLAIALLVGVALAHQLTLPIILLPALWFVLSAAPGLLRRPRLIAAAIGLALLPLISYAYVYAAGASHPEWRGAGAWTNTWDWFLGFVSTGQGRSELTWSWTPFLTPEFPALIWREITVPGLCAGLLGWVVLGRRQAIFLYASLALYLALCWIDRLGNWYQVIMPVYALLAMVIGIGADWLWRRAGAWGIGRAVILLGLASLLLYRGVVSFPGANSRNRPDDTGLAPGWAILADAPPAGTIVLGTLPEEVALNYVTRIWGQRPDMRAITAEQARTLLAQGAPVAVTQAALPLVAQEVSSDAHYSALGRTLVALYETFRVCETLKVCRDLPAGLQSWTHDFGPSLRLAGGKTEFNPATGETVVLLAWEAKEIPAEDWSVSVRLTQGEQEIAQVDYTHPVFGAYPTSRWSPGERVGDAYPFKLPPGAKPDGVTVILYRRTPEGGFVNLDVARFPL